VSAAPHLSPAKVHASAYRCRCRHCRTRTTLRHHPEWYIRRRYARCPRCKRDALSVDSHRTSGREHRRVTRHCGHYPFPHRRASLLCEHGVMGRAGFSYWSRYEAEHIHFEQWLAGEQAEPYLQEHAA
jgi:hypothetical protein